MRVRTGGVRLLFFFFLVYLYIANSRNMIITNPKVNEQPVTIPMMAPVDKPLYVI